MIVEFVVFDASGKEVDWYDPYEGHVLEPDGSCTVDNGYAKYRVEIPPGGRWVVRTRADDDERTKL